MRQTAGTEMQGKDCSHPLENVSAGKYHKYWIKNNGYFFPKHLTHKFSRICIFLDLVSVYHAIKYVYVFFVGGGVTLVEE